MTFWFGSFVTLGFAMSVGCGGGSSEGIDVQGKLLDGGQPATVKDYTEGYNYYEVSLVPVGEGKGAWGDVKQDGSFTIRGLAPGKFHVGVKKFKNPGEGPQDEFQGQLEAQKSSLTVDVEAGKEITVELKELLGGAKAKP